jgi:hypothetical protein
LKHTVVVGAGHHGAVAGVSVVVPVHAPRRRSVCWITSRTSSSWSGTPPTT